MEAGINDGVVAPNPPECGTTEKWLSKSTHCSQAGVGCNARRLTADDRFGALISVGTYNCEGVLSALSFVGELLLSLDVVFLAETWLSQAEEHYLPSYLKASCSLDCYVVQEFAMDFPPGAGSGRRHGGVAMVCRNRPGLQYDRIKCDDERLCGVSIRDQTGPRLTVLGCYMPYWDSTTSTLDEFSHLVSKLGALVTALGTTAPIMLVGDFNCALPRMSVDQRPIRWHELRGFSKCSAVMQEFLDEHDLTVAEFLFPQPVSFTYERGHSRTHIDHIAVSSRLLGSVASCDIVPQSVDNLSPHLPICVKIRLILHVSVKSPSTAASSGVVKRPDILRWDCNQRNELYRDTLEQYLADRIPPERDMLNIDHLDACITDCIHAAARESQCAKPWRQPKFWWTPTVSDARDKARFWFKLWTDSGRQVNSVVHACYCEARRAYRRARKHAARARIDEEARFLHTLRRDQNINAFWRRVNSVRRGGQPVRSKLTANDFANQFASVNQDDESQLSPAQQLICDAVAARFSAGCDATEIRSVSPTEVSLPEYEMVWINPLDY